MVTRRKLAVLTVPYAALVYASLNWMLHTDPSALTLRAMVPMLTFAMVVTLGATYMIVSFLDWIYPPPKR